MKCPDCRIPMSVDGDEHTCPECGRVVALRDVGYAPLLAPEPERLRFRPAPAAQAVFDAIAAPADEIPPALHAELLAELDAAGVTAHRHAPMRCAMEGCGAWFVPLSSNARFCKTRIPLCEAVHQRRLRLAREAVAS